MSKNMELSTSKNILQAFPLLQINLLIPIHYNSTTVVKLVAKLHDVAAGRRIENVQKDMSIYMYFQHTVKHTVKHTCSH